MNKIAWCKKVLPRERKKHTLPLSIKYSSAVPSRGGYPIQSWLGYPPPIGLDGVSPAVLDGVYPLQYTPSQAGWGTPLSGWMRYPSIGEWGNVTVNRETPVKTVHSRFLRNAGGENSNGENDWTAESAII